MLPPVLSSYAKSLINGELGYFHVDGWVSSAIILGDACGTAWIAHIKEDHAEGQALWIVKIVKGNETSFFTGDELPVGCEINERDFTSLMNRVPPSGDLIPVENFSCLLETSITKELFLTKWHGEDVYSCSSASIRLSNGVWLCSPYSNKDKISEEEVGKSPKELGWKYESDRGSKGKNHQWWSKPDPHYDDKHLRIYGKVLEHEFPVNEYWDKKLFVKRGHW
jgi:hypothetical protein